MAPKDLESLSNEAWSMLAELDDALLARAKQEKRTLVAVINSGSAPLRPA